MHVFRLFFWNNILFGQQIAKRTSAELRSCVDAYTAGQRHIGVHVWANFEDGGATCHAGADEDQEEKLTYGKCLVVHLP